MRKTFAIISVTVLSLIIFLPSAFATLVPKINNLTQSELTLQTGCVGSDLYFTGSVQNLPPVLPVTYPSPRWTGSGAFYLSNTDIPNPTFNCPIPGDYEITYSAIENGITYSITQNIKVVNKDILTLVSPAVLPLSVCEATAFTLEASGTKYYYWEREKDAVVTSLGTSASLIETPPTFGTWTYRVYGANDGCESDPSYIEFQVIVDEPATVNAGGTYSTCSGVGVALNGSIGGSATSAEWIGGAGTFNPNRTTLNATYIPHASESGTDVILILRTDDPAGICSYAESSTTITVYSLPTVTLNPFADVCIDFPAFVLSGGSPAGGVYSGTGVSGGNFDPSVAGVGSHVITYTYTDGNGCSGFATNTITVNALPVVTLAAFADVCVDASPFALSGGNPAGGVYSGTGVSGGNFNPSVAGVGSHTITYTYTDANGCSNFATNTITVNALPVVTLAAFADVCVDAAPFALSGGNPAGGVYSGTGVSGGNFNPAVAGVGTHTITYTYTDVNGCSNFATNTITVNALPIVTLSAFADVCVDAAPFALSGGNPAGGVYSGTGVGGGNFDPSIAGVGTHTITYTYIDPSGCTNFATNTITVNPLPVVTLGAFADVCLNESPFSLTGGNPVGGTYSGTGVSGGSFNPSVAGVGTHTITYTYTDANGCSNFATNSITVNALPVVTLGAFADVCVDGATFALSGGNPAGGVYSGTGVSGGNFSPSVAGIGTHTITYTYTDVSGCSNFATSTITVNALPVVTLSSFSPVCIDALPFALSGGSPAGGTYSGVGVSGGNFDPAVAGVGTHTITYSYTDPAGCFNSATNTIDVNPLPLQFNVTGGGSYCFGDPGIIIGLDDSQIGVTYTLYKDGNPTATTQTGTGNSISFGYQTIGVYTVFAQVNTTACSQAMLGSAVVAETPAINGNTISADQIICSGSSPAQLTGPIPTGGSGVYTYQWQSSTVSATGPFADISGANNQNYSPSALTQTTYFQRVVTSGVCSSPSNAVTVTVNPSIANNTISADQTICYNTAPSQLTGSIPTGGSGVYTYQWQSSTAGAGGPFTDIVGETSVDYQPGNLTQNTWFRRIVNSIPCTNDISNIIAITVSPEFLVTGFTSVDPTCNGYTNGSATVNTSGGIAPYTYSWNTSPVQTSQTATGLSAGINYTVTVTDAFLCSAIGNVTLTEPAPISLGSITINAVTGCSGDSNGSIQIVGAGGTPEYTYTLYDSGNNLIATQSPALPAGANFTALLGGTYSVNIDDANGCPSFVQTNIVVDQPAPITITDVQTTPISCAGYSDGTITIIASGGTGALEYSINNGVTFQPGNVFNVGEGYYDIVVRDANGCSAAWPTVIELTEPAEISFEYSVKNVTTCNGDNTGRITIYNVSGGSGTGYEYSIYQPESWGTNPVFDNLAGGPANLYYVKVRDSHGCIQVANNGDPITLTQPSAINFTVNTVDVTGCWYNTNGRITISGVSGGTGSKTVSIDGINYFPTTKIFNVGIGTYTVYVKDANGCISTKPAVISGPPAITVDNVTITDATCFGSPDGTVDATASGGTPPLEYSLDGVTYQASGLFNGVTGGNYTLFVRDANGCVLEQAITVGQPAALYFTTQIATDITCSGLTDGQITLEAAGGTAPYSYSITGGAPYGNTTGIFTGLSAGTYTVSVLDDKGCSILGDELTVNEPALLQISGTASTDITCFGQANGTITITAIGGTEPRVYRLLDAGLNELANNTDGLFTGIDAGTYTVEVTDVNSCAPVSTLPITINEPIEITINSVDVTDVSGCNGDNNGALTINASGGTGILTYSIDGGTNFQASNIFTALTGGSYSIVVKDANDCIQTGSAIVGQPDPVTIDDLTIIQETVSGAGDGQILVTAIGGTGSFTYDLYLDGAFYATQTPIAPAGAAFTNLGAGTYYVIVTDGNGCFIQTADILISGTSVVVTSTMVSCNGSNDGSILLTITGGFPPFTIGCTNSASQPFTFTDLGGGQFELTGLAPETYTITIADTKTTYPDEIVIITEPTILTATYVNVVNPTCNGLSDGSVEFNITGGTAPYTITWTGGTSTGNIATNVAAGSYTFTIADANGCSVDVVDVPALVEPPAITVTDFVKVDVTCNGQANGSITVTATGGTGLLTYSLTGPVNLSNNDGIFADLPAGTYTLSITDVNSCPVTIDVNPINIVEPSAIVITGTTSLPLDCANTPDGFVNIDVTGGQPGYTFLWSNGETTEDLTGVVKGTYSVIVTDAANCSVTSQDFVIDGADMLDLIADISPADCYNLWKGTSTDGTIKDFGEIRIVNFTGGNGSSLDDFTYLWNHPVGNPSTDKVLSNLSAGTYLVTVTDTKGCVYTQPFNVPIKPRYDYSVFAGKDTTVCFDNPVTLHGEVTGGDADLTFTYGWFILPDISGDPIFTGQDYIVQTTGTNTYRLRVVDSDEACWNDTTVTLSVLPAIGLHVPMYISSVKDTIISILYGQETNMDVNTESVAFETTFQWKPAEMFLPSNNWNTTLLLNDEIQDQIPADRFVTIKDPITGKSSDYIVVDVIATTEPGCIDSIRLYTKIIDDVSFGNIFSPNGDGKNDLWKVPKNYLFPDLEIEIFNRWGSLVWSAKGDKAARGWDGRTDSGKELPIGTYYYVVKFNVKSQSSGWKPLTGSVTIVK